VSERLLHKKEEKNKHICLLNLQFSLLNSLTQQVLNVIDNFHFLYKVQNMIVYHQRKITQRLNKND